MIVAANVVGRIDLPRSAALGFWHVRPLRHLSPHLTWADVHEILSGFRTVRTEPINDMAPNDHVRPSDPQLAARLDRDELVLDRMLRS